LEGKIAKLVGADQKEAGAMPFTQKKQRKRQHLAESRIFATSDCAYQASSVFVEVLNAHYALKPESLVGH